MRRSCTSMVRNLIRNNKSLLLSPLLNEALMSPATIIASSYSNPFSISILTPTLTTSSILHRHLCSSPSGPSNIVVIDSEEKFNSSLRKVQDEALPGILYFTAVWCGPCRLLSPIIGQLSEKYPHVTTYKIDIDQEGLEGTLSNLNIHSVPTLHFFKDGKKVSEVIGADVQRLKNTMENLYK